MSDSFLQTETLEVLQLFFAAGVGAGFYSLWTAHKYIRNRTFDPQYNQLYVVRFVLGIVAGTILGYSMSEFFKGDTSFAAELTPSLLAIVGGYSADAVAQILQRIADTLVTIVKGSDDGDLDAERAVLRVETQEEKLKIQTELEQQAAIFRNKVVKTIYDVKSSIGETSVADAKVTLDELLEDLHQS